MPAAFTYLPPAVTGVRPATGPPGGGTRVLIGGTNLQGATGVSFGQTPASSYTVVSNAWIVAYSPPGTGSVDVTVTNPAGTSAITSLDHFTH